MSWYPAKYASQAIKAAGQLASTAAAAAQTTVTRGFDGVKSAYDAANSHFNDATQEVVDALNVASNRQRFEDRARSVIQNHRNLIDLLGKASGQLSKTGFADVSTKLLTPGVVSGAAQAKSLTADYAQTSPAIQEVLKLMAEFPVLSIGWHASAAAGVGVEIAGLGSPIPILRMDRKDFVPYPYSEAAVHVGAQLAADLGITLGAFKGQANTQWGFFVVASVFAGQGAGANIDVYFRLPDGEFDGIVVGVNAEVDVLGAIDMLPAGAYVGVGRTFSLPLVYLKGGYDRATAG